MSMFRYFSIQEPTQNTITLLDWSKSFFFFTLNKPLTGRQLSSTALPTLSVVCNFLQWPSRILAEHHLDPEKVGHIILNSWYMNTNQLYFFKFNQNSLPNFKVLPNPFPKKLTQLPRNQKSQPSSVTQSPGVKGDTLSSTASPPPSTKCYLFHLLGNICLSPVRPW